MKFPIKEKYFCCVSCSSKYSSSFKKSLSDETKSIISNKIKELWKNTEYAKKFLDKKRFSSKGERELRKNLKERYGYKNVSSHCNVSLNNIRKAVDLTIVSKNVIIEYDGIWHFDSKIYERMGTPEKYKDTLEKDAMVNEYCKLNNIRLLRISDKVYHKNRSLAFTNIINFIETSDLLYFELY